MRLDQTHLADSARAAQIKRRAQKISDPIERLKYLRRVAIVSNTPARTPFAAWKWAASLILAALVVVIVPLGAHALSRDPVIHKKPAAPVHYPAVDTTAVWPVEQTSQYDLYSNGLRIENRLEISNQPRSYTLIEAGTGQPGPRRSQPAGIVFHVTESRQAPFEASQKSAIQRIGKDLLVYLRGKRAYHFVIDRFGRVNRIVVESDTANHAGNSVWADSKWMYLDLNASFIGVAFEGRTRADQPPINEPQLHAAKVLTEMLRDKYNLPAEDCVTHAQVSVNPENMRIGWHTDWGTNFPYKEVGLPDNYAIPIPALYLFGFEYDSTYVDSTGPDLWKGLSLADQRLRDSAAERGVTVGKYRVMLHKKYKDALSTREAESLDEDR